MIDLSPPPRFYLTHYRESLVIYFTDVRSLPMSYTSSPVSVPLPNMNTPYRAQGSGSGWTWSVAAKINPWHAFTGEKQTPDGHFREGAVEDMNKAAYQDFLKFFDLFEEYGPSPILALHMPTPDGGRSYEVMLTAFGAEPSMRESNVFNGVESFPSIIPVELSLQEYVRYRIKVGS